MSRPAHTGAPTNRWVRRLAERIDALERNAKAQNAPQLKYSSIDAGAIEINDINGDTVARVGTQPDGTHGVVVVAGPTPPVPSGFTAEGGQLSVTATWAGTFADDVPAPLDFEAVEVHTADGRVGTITAVEGASLSFGAVAGPLSVSLRTRSKSGEVSELTDPIAVEVASAVDPAIFAQLEEDLTAADGRLSQAEQDLADAQVDVDRALDIGRNISPDPALITTPPADVVSQGGTFDYAIFHTAAPAVKRRATTAPLSFAIARDVPVIPGRVWRVSAWARAASTFVAPSGTATGLRVVTSPSGTVTQIAPPPSDATWHPLVALVTIPAGDTSLTAWIGDASASAGLLVFDDVGVAEMLDEVAIPKLDVGTGTYGELSGGRLTANTITANKLVINDVTAAVAAILHLDVSQLVVTGSAAISTAVIDKLFAQTFAANKITGDEIDAGLVAAAVGEFVKVKAENIEAGSIDVELDVTAGKVIAGNAEIGDGVQTFVTDAETGLPRASTRLGVPGSDGALEIGGASISPEGDIVGNTLAVEASDMLLGGSPLFGTMVDPAAGPSLLDNWPRGVIAIRNLRDLSRMSTAVTGANESILGQFEVALPPGRSYRLEMPWRCSPGPNGSPAGLSFSVRARVVTTLDGTTPADPTVSSPVIGDSSGRAPASGTTGDSGVLLANVVNAATTVARVKFGIDLYAAAGTVVTPSLYDPLSWVAYLSDTGPTPSILPAAEPGSPAPQTYTSTWVATDSRSWYTDGSQVGSGSKANMWLGRTAENKIAHSAFVCNGNAELGEVGKSMSAALTGATISKVEVGVQSLAWEAGFGTLSLAPFTGSTLPATSTGNPTAINASQFTARAQWRWVPITNSAITVNATNRGVFLTDGGAGIPVTHGYFAGATYATASQRPRIRVTYSR